MIDEDLLIEMEELAARIEFCGSDPIPLNKEKTEWEFTKNITRRQAEIQTCAIYRVSLREFYSALKARDSSQAQNHRAA